MRLKSFGFTVIELMVVMSIIGALASTSLVALNSARMKARDAKRLQDLNTLRTALVLFHSNKNKFPRHYATWDNVPGNPGGFAPGGAPNNQNGACDAIVPGAIGADPNSGFIHNVVPEAYNASMQELVDAGVLGKIINSPGGPGYCYTDRGPGNSSGVVLMTALETGEPTLTGLPGSCRFGGAGNWCSYVNPSRVHCLCIPY